MVIGLDVGGTNIDAVIIKAGQIISKVKMPLAKEDLLDTILTTLDKLLLGYDKTTIKRINLSTTVSTNAIVKNDIARVGMLIQSGPGLLVDSLACGHDNQFLKGSIDHRGREVEELDIKEVKKTIKKFKQSKIETCAVVTKFSTRNPSHEIKIKEMLGQEFDFTTAGHMVSGKLNFPRRVYTSYLNSAVHKTFNDFSKNIEEALGRQGINAPIYILKADGGTMDFKSAKEKPVETILSGPAASFMGISALLPAQGDSLFLDIGGTTTDLFFLAQGIPVFEPLGITIDGYKTLVRSIYSVSIGLGGDSRIEVTDGKIKIGPEKEDKPYALGGDKPTPTDAMIALGLIEIGDKQKAKKAMNGLGHKLGSSQEDIARLILETMGDIIKRKVDSLLEEINGKPVYTVEEVLHGKKIIPEHINIIGGPAKHLAPILEQTFGLPCAYPENYQLANAIGAALAKPTLEITLLADTQRKMISVPELAIYKKITGKYDLSAAKRQAIGLLKEQINLIDHKHQIVDKDIEITEESSFNMVDGFYTRGQNIRVQAQVKPGLTHIMRSEQND